MTTGVDSCTNLPILQNITVSNAQNTTYPTCQYPNPIDKNSLSVGIASSLAGNSGDDFSYSETCEEGGILAVYLPIALSGMEFVNNSTSAHPGMALQTFYSVSGLPYDNGKTYIQYACMQHYNSGLNITGENSTYTKVSGDAVLLLSGGIALVAASTALAIVTAGGATPAVIAATGVLSSLEVADSVISYSQSVDKCSFFNDNGFYHPGDSPGCIKTLTDNGSFKATKGSVDISLMYLVRRNYFLCVYPTQNLDILGNSILPMKTRLHVALVLNVKSLGIILGVPLQHFPFL